MKKKILQTFLLGMFAVFSGSIFAQHEVSGIIKDDFGADLPGASVRIKGTNEGTITDLNGYYKISVPSSSSILIFSFVGMSPKEVTVGAQTEINVVLQAADQDIKEVVITALGISREEKSLGYSVGKVSGDDLTKVNHENVLDALSGKTSGVQISSTGGPGSSLSIIIRGATSLNSDNQPLFVIDGVPVFNSLNNLGDLVSESVVDYGNSISDINPADIESVSILKGPSAAALYGSRAGNGVVMITTKSGKKGKKGIGVYLSSGVTFDKPYRFLPQQTRFTSGAFGMGMYEEGFGMWFGPETDLGIEAEQWAYDGNKKPLVAYPNKTRDFLNTGVTYNNNVGVTGNYEKGSFRLSLADMYNVGVIPNTDLHKKTFSLSTNYKVTEDFNVSTNINILENGSDNRSAGGKSVTNVLYALDNIPPHMPLSAFAGNYWEDGQEDRQQRIFDPKFANPYFVANELLNSFQRNRIYGNMKLNWQIVPKLSLMGRISLDRYNEIRESKIPWSYPDIPYGAYGIQTFNNTEINADFLVSYEDTFGDIKLNLSGGGNSRDVSGNNIVNNTNRLVLPGLFTISNAEGGPTSYFNSTYEKVVYSLYGMATVSYKDMVYLDLTARNDWSSTLPEDNRSYFYPSASISVLINEMIEMPSSIDMIKLRGGVAQVGNDTGPYSLIPSLGTYDDWGNLKRIYVQDALLSEDLKPEIATSYELGADFTFFDNRLTISPTYYVVQNKNQILSITDMPASSGYSSKKINAGLVESRGWELGVLTT
ncbi:MAG: SusC/RagA family TonB-linked outer membrane protein, partial [Bacteroidota bacterium]